MKRLLHRVAAAFRPATARAAHRRPGAGHQVSARIEEPMMADRRMAKYQKPLHSALVAARLGRVTGGGSVQGTDGSIQWISLELELKDLGTALFFAQAKLRDLGAPARSCLKFERDGTSEQVPIR